MRCVSRSTLRIGRNRQGSRVGLFLGLKYTGVGRARSTDCRCQLRLLRIHARLDAHCQAEPAGSAEDVSPVGVVDGVLPGPVRLATGHLR
jgi:hypothetical protein